MNRYNLLVEFAHKHLDFHRAELESVLDMYGITLDGPNCTILPLPNTAATTTETETRPFWMLSFPMNSRGLQYHLYDTNESLDGSVHIATVLARCTLVRSVVELWGVD
jgi:tRNA (guanine10-N2)-methyltransferase